jgi:hypothetical protein
VPGVKLICFDPDPGTTRGEAEFIGKLSRQYHWRSLVLVTINGQDTRARILVGRCFTGSIYAVTAAVPMSNWPYQIAYGWGALVKALTLHRAC